MLQTSYLETATFAVAMHADVSLATQHSNLMYFAVLGYSRLRLGTGPKAAT